MRFQPKQLIGFGFFLVFLGFLLPLLIVVKVLPSTFFLNFFAFGASIAGLYLGIIGASGLYIERKNRNKMMNDDWINSPKQD